MALLGEIMASVMHPKFLGQVSDQHLPEAAKVFGAARGDWDDPQKVNVLADWLRERGSEFGESIPQLVDPSLDRDLRRALVGKPGWYEPDYPIESVRRIPEGMPPTMYDILFGKELMPDATVVSGRAILPEQMPLVEYSDILNGQLGEHVSDSVRQQHQQFAQAPWLTREPFLTKTQYNVLHPIRGIANAFSVPPNNVNF